jgi:hypothetical protein
VNEIKCIFKCSSCTLKGKGQFEEGERERGKGEGEEKYDE